MQFAKETALEARAIAHLQEAVSQRATMLMYAVEYSNVRVWRLLRRVVFKCWYAFVKYGGSASYVATSIPQLPFERIRSTGKLWCVANYPLSGW